MQLKLSRCAEDEECSAVLSNHVKPAKHSKMKVLASIGEDMRTVPRDTELLLFRMKIAHTEAWNRQESEFSARNIVLDLNYHESTALVDAHAKKCKLRTEAESARAEAVAQRTSFVDLEESKSRLIPELEELTTCSCQSDTKFDQSSLQVVMKLEDRYLSRVCAFPACSTPDHKSKSFKKL